MRLPPAVAIVLLLSPAPLFSRAGAPPDIPDVPALVADGSTAPRSFVVNGVVRSAAKQGVAFRFATDGARQFCSLYDPTDGTPLFLSDGWQTLVYDLPGGRVVRVPNCRGVVRVDWDRHHPKPLKFDFDFRFESNREKLSQYAAWFGVDAFVAASRPKLVPLESTDGTRLFSAERPGGSVETVQVPAGAVQWFRFTSLDRKDGFYRLQLEARHIGGEVPAAALAFPDLRQLRETVRVHDLEQDLLPTFLAAIRDGRAWLVKSALVTGDEDPPTPPPGVPAGTTWADLRKQDKELGAAYRAALQKQGVWVAASTEKFSDGK